MTYVLLVDLSPPIGIRLMMTEEFLGMRAPSSVYSVSKGKNDKVINQHAEFSIISF